MLLFSLQFAKELLVGLNSSVEDSLFVFSPHIPHCDNWLSEALFFYSMQFFLHLELSRGTIIAAKTGQVVKDLKLEVK